MMQFKQKIDCKLLRRAVCYPISSVQNVEDTSGFYLGFLIVLDGEQYLGGLNFFMDVEIKISIDSNDLESAAFDNIHHYIDYIDLKAKTLTFYSIFNTLAPIQTISANKPPSPWLTNFF